MASPQADVVLLDELTARAAELTGADPRSQRPEWRAETVAFLLGLGPGPSRLPAGPPELQLVMAKLYLQLWADLPVKQLPDWERGAPLPQVQLAWLRTELAVCPERLPVHLTSPLLRPALGSLSVAELPAPLALATQLARCSDEELQGLAMPLGRAALHAGREEPTPVHALVVGLLSSPHATVVTAALEELAEPWALCFPYPREFVAAIMKGSSAGTEGAPGIARAALRLAAAAGQDGPLHGLVVDPTAAPARRREALLLLAHLGRRDDLGSVLAAAREDPLLLGSAALGFLHGRHQRGHFVGAEHIAAILELYLGNTELGPEALAPVLYPARAALLDHVANLTADDPRWERLLPLLCAVAPDEPAVAPRLRTLLASATEPHRQQQVLAALGTIRDSAAEELILTLLPVLPEAALQALRAVGGAPTASALATALGLSEDLPSGDPAAWLLPFSDRAVALLWQLVDEESPERATLQRCLNPAALPAELRADLGTRPLPAEATLRRLAEASDRQLSAAAALRTAALTSDVAAAEALLLRCIAALHGGAEPKDGDWVEEAPRVPGEALGGIRALGRRLYERGRIRPHCLLDAKTATQAGELLLADLALRLLARADLAEGERIILLKLLHADVAPWALPQLAARLRPLLRDRSVHVRKLAIQCLGRRGAERLSHNLTRLLTADDIQTVRQALLALGEMKARFAAEAIAGCLEHPNMNIKKAAAAALAQAGTPRVVPRLLFWLGYHDNPGLRDLLQAALTAILGPALHATLRAAHARAATPREQELLSEALQRWTSRADHRSARKVSPPPEELRPQITALGQKGWEPGRARAVLTLLNTPSAAPLQPAERATLRPYLVEWLGLGVQAVPLIAQVWEGALEKRQQTLLTDHLELLLAGLQKGGPGRASLLELLEQLAPHLRPRAALGVAAAYRELPPEPNLRGRPPFALLRACAALLTESDLHRALAECAGTSDPRAAERAVLLAAFALGDEPVDNSAAQSALRTAAVAGERALKALRDNWSLHNRPRATLRLLAAAYPDAPTAAQPLLLSWMLVIQAPFVSSAGDDKLPPPRPRKEKPPITLMVRTEWLAQLGALDPEDRRTAAQALLELPDLVAQDAVLTAYLAGKFSAIKAREAFEQAVLPPLAQRLAAWPEDRVRQATRGTGQLRLARLGAVLPLSALPRFMPLLLRLWMDGDAELSGAAAAALSGLPAEALLPAIEPLLVKGRWGALDLLSGTIQETPAWAALLTRLAAEGLGERAAALRQRTVAGPLAGAAAVAAALAGLHERELTVPLPQPALAAALPRQELFRLARQLDRNQAESVRAALSALAQNPDAEVVALLIAQLVHPSPRVRLHAHRLLRGCVDRQRYLELTCHLLDDKDPNTRRAAVRALAHGRHTPALPRLLALLGDPMPILRTAAAEGIRLFGKTALPLLISTQRKERPDRRAVYAAVITAIEQDVRKTK